MEAVNGERDLSIICPADKQARISGLEGNGAATLQGFFTAKVRRFLRGTPTAGVSTFPAEASFFLVALGKGFLIPYIHTLHALHTYSIHTFNTSNLTCPICNWNESVLPDSLALSYKSHFGQITWHQMKPKWVRSWRNSPFGQQRAATLCWRTASPGTMIDVTLVGNFPTVRYSQPP